MRSWVKTPIDLVEFPGIAELGLNHRWTYICLFTRARRVPAERIGWVLDGHGRPPSLSTVATWCGIPKSTARRHVFVLQERGLLQRDLGGKLIVPLVVALERRFARRTSSPDAVDNPGSEPVDNPGLALQFDDPAVPQNGVAVPPVAQRFFVCSSEEENFVVDDVGENPEAEPRFPIDLAPPEIADPDLRYAIGKLADASDVWAAAIARPRDRANLVRLASSQPVALIGALRMQLADPTARNPLAWLNRAVTDLAEVAS